MLGYSCGGAHCRARHVIPDEVCSHGPWKCNRVSPPCAWHGHHGQRCPDREGDLWRCRRRGCRGRHGSRDDHCQGGHYVCNLATPRCPTHARYDDACSPQQVRARQNAACGAGDSANSAAVSCPAAEYEVVELLEVTRHDGEEHMRRPPGDRRQYVNLDERTDPDAPRYEYGQIIWLRARVQRRRGGSDVANLPVYFYATPGRRNREPLHREEGPSCGFSASSTGGTLRRVVRTASSGWTDAVPFRLSRYGGDTFTVHATHDAAYAGGLQAGVYTVWRRLWYEICEMQRPHGGLYEMPPEALNRVRNAYQAAFIEMLSAGSKGTGPYRANFASLEDAYQWGDGQTSARLTPWKIQYLIVDQAEPADTVRTDDVEYDVTRSGDVHIRTPFLPYRHGRNGWLVEATYDKDDEWHDLPASHVRLDSDAKVTHLIVNLDGLDLAPSPQNPVAVTIRVRHTTGANGWGGKCLHLVLCRGLIEQQYDDPASKMAGTAIHELGHGLGLVYSGRFDLPWASHARGQDDHCNRERCVMWWQGYVGRPQAFHRPSRNRDGNRSCETHLRGIDMRRDIMFPLFCFPRDEWRNLQQLAHQLGG